LAARISALTKARHGDSLPIPNGGQADAFVVQDQGGQNTIDLSQIYVYASIPVDTRMVEAFEYKSSDPRWLNTIDLSQIYIWPEIRGRNADRDWFSTGVTLWRRTCSCCLPRFGPVTVSGAPVPVASPSWMVIKLTLKLKIGQWSKTW
jgi:hypothetical protein